MPHYRARFHGCTRGAIGIHYWIVTEVTADDPKAAELALYEHYDHIQRLTLTEVPKHDHYDQTENG